MVQLPAASAAPAGTLLSWVQPNAPSVLGRGACRKVHSLALLVHRNAWVSPVQHPPARKTPPLALVVSIALSFSMRIFTPLSHAHFSSSDNRICALSLGSTDEAPCLA
jgi:hypothetical protein